MSDDELNQDLHQGLKAMENQPFDEAYDIDDPEEIASTLTVSPQPKRQSTRQMDRGNTPPHTPSDQDNSEYDDQDAPRNPRAQAGPPPKGGAAAAAARADHGGHESASESMESSSEETDKIEPKMEGAYNPKDYENLPVSQEIKELFAYISRFSPQIQDLDTKLKPFIPDFIPAVGDIDAFIKIPRPDAKITGLGLDQLDEPCAAQSDPTVLDLQLRAISKMTVTRGLTVKVVENTAELPKAIDSWISSIGELHRTKPPQTVHLSHPMPDAEALLQEWPPEFEELLRSTDLPSAELDVPLKDYADIVCGLLDIPVFKSRVQSLHVLFNLFSEMRTLKQMQAQAAAPAAAETVKF
eukprot:m.227686 g.227686  ORF g.227686 m.227686 type:complete len:354 (+) comp17283_c0_seq1:75-1136(+)